MIKSGKMNDKEYLEFIENIESEWNKEYKAYFKDIDIFSVEYDNLKDAFESGFKAGYKYAKR
jgi:hypothetical protein